MKTDVSSTESIKSTSHKINYITTRSRALKSWGFLESLKNYEKSGCEKGAGTGSSEGFRYELSHIVNSHLGVLSISTQVMGNSIKSVKNIQKITKTMKMVAASKLRAVQGRA
ncbi:unnamed protein product [Eruca vesicaria subsp. sativa]|uniref:Uncharacterized protein n=1 Tax=Eruca vesicaria subsp. sativa TaxID=29727 RepID=A0ABC8J3W3_ERUVS|nr:unnamed protein product [Eruca vesicaria subsp. sativa]